MSVLDFDAPQQPPVRGGQAADAPPVVPVGLLVSSARLILERHLGVMWVAGEVSNLFRAGSGHVYFTLKDATAQVKCTLWRTKAQLVPFTLREGMAVEVRALPSMYEARGEFQLNVDVVRHAGVGALYERFLALKAKLQAAGWLDEGRKRPLPAFPRRVGVVTSPRGAALRDVLTTIERRWPQMRVILYPCAVQGEGAAAEIAQALRTANARREVDVLVVCRGGGSIEDLWAFNEEAVARAVVESALPVVSGVGHETDFTICDFVADVRAPTPTAAAALVAPDCAAHRHRSQQVAARLHRALGHVLANAEQRVDRASRQLVHPAARIAAQRDRCADLARRLARAVALRQDDRDRAVAAARARLCRELRAPLPGAERVAALRAVLVRAGPRTLDRGRARIEALAQNLAHLNPEAVLARGYAIVSDASGGIVTDAQRLDVGDEVSIALARGKAHAAITRRD
ncbi:MAG TPA: exodeoxyribonuclease VII large subunit [Casimicrobiaceae bacterium]|nr:exodeoxyribonuclease VII large subunit [Casimicrobiaceae bacterium]